MAMVMVTEAGITEAMAMVTNPMVAIKVVTDMAMAKALCRPKSRRQGSTLKIHWNV